MTTTYDPNKLVPYIPTAEMIKSGIDAFNKSGSVIDSYLAMLSATPEITLNQWQDIDREDSSTFPEHGTLFLLAHFDDYRNKWIVETDYFSTGTHSRSYHSYATHWMPLPPAPEVV